jgi:hypothetical protein
MTKSLSNHVIRDIQKVQNFFLEAIDFSKNKENVAQWPAWKVAVYSAVVSEDEKWEIYPLLNRTQRQFFFHLQVWSGDEINLHSFEQFLTRLASLESDDHTTELQKHFLMSDDFQLFLKTKYTINSFDAEFPEYPDHDEYFLSPDNSFIFIYDNAEEAPNISRDKQLVQFYYDTVGLEPAYESLLRMMGETYSILLESKYEEKVKNDLDLGWVDYFDALEVVSLYRTESSLRKKAKEIAAAIRANTYGLENDQNFKQIHFENQELKYFYKTLVYYWVAKGVFNKESAKTSEDSKNNFFQTISSIGVGMIVGLQFTEKAEGIKISELSQLNLFELFKMGNSIIFLWKKNLQECLRPIVSLGIKLEFLGVSFKEDYEKFYNLPNLKRDNEEESAQWSNYNFLESRYEWQKEFLKLTEMLGGQYQVLVKDFKVRSELYENYNVTEITMEEIFINSIIRFSVNKLKQTTDAEKGQLSFGIWKEDFLDFLQQFPQMRPSGEFARSVIKEYMREWKLPDTEEWVSYFLGLFNYHLVGINYEDMQDSEWEHVGGVVLFKIKKGVEDISQ